MTSSENGAVPVPGHQQQLRVLLITSNVGSLFGPSAHLLRNYWLDQMSSTIATTSPAFVALHLQESGGKNYRHHCREMPGLVEELCQRLDLLGFVAARCLLDIEHELMEQFTGLSSLYFVHRSALGQVGQYNFRHRNFVPITSQNDDNNYSSAIISTTHGLHRSGWARKQKFPKEFWTTFRWGRKGFLHTRWRVGARLLDLINLHLFHDESNLNFLEDPSEYSSNRRRALQYTLNEFEQFNKEAAASLEDSGNNSNLFLFGDFNFRLSLAPLVKRLASHTMEREIVLMLSDDDEEQQKRRGHSVSDTSSCGGGTVGGGHNSPSPRTDSSEDSGLAREEASSSEPEEAPTASSCGEEFEQDQQQQQLMMRRRRSSVIEYFRPVVRELLSPTDEPNKMPTNWVLRVGKKRFDVCDTDRLLNEWRAYREDDNELKQYPLEECPIDFPPTYPWSEDPDSPDNFMNTRPPAWCDRVVFNATADRELISKDQHCQYRSFGRERCIGDHKPVMLLFSLCPSTDNKDDDGIAEVLDSRMN